MMDRTPTLKVVAPTDVPVEALHDGDSVPPTIDAQPDPAQPGSPPHPDRTIGDIIRDSLKLSPEQVDRVLECQRRHGIRFGEAAVKLKLATSEDVLSALAQQFHYPFMPREHRKVLSGELVAARHPFSARSEVFRSVRSQAVKRMASLGQRAAIAVVSPQAGDGKTYFAANLAVTFSQLRRNTLLIDADLRNPRLHEVFGVANGTGLSNTLSGRRGQVVRPVEHLPNLYLLPAGAVPPNPLELADSPSFTLLIARVLERFDHVIVDTSATAHGADAAVISSHCGAALVIGRQGHSHLSALQGTVQTLQNDGTNVLGMLVVEH